MKYLYIAFLLLGASPLATLAQTPSPSPDAAAVKSAVAQREDPVVTKAAKDLYAQLVSQKVDRSKLADRVNTALTDAVVASISSQFSALGTPQWSFVGTTSAPQGDASVYKLTYPQSTLYMTFGQTTAGITFALLFSPQAPQL